jgi:hypothetical protein
MVDENANEVIVHTEQKDLTLAQLRDMCDANDIITNPDYQRNYVYDDKQASSLVESILIGIPIPIIYLCEEEDGVFSVIDGQQRITSFVRYLKNEFALVGLTTSPDFNKFYYRDLPKAVQRRLNSKALKAICLNRDSQHLKYEIFARLNLGAVKLKDQEVRNCIYRGNFNNMLKDIAKDNEALKVLFHDENKRSAYEERILRFFALRNYLELKGTYKKTMNQYMESHQKDDEHILQSAKAQYNGLIDIIKQSLGNDAFFSDAEGTRKKFNGSIYDSIIIPFSYFPKQSIMKHSDAIRTAIENLKQNDEEYKNFVYVGTNAGPRVRGRMKKVMDILNDIIGASENSPRNFSSHTKSQLFYDGYICGYCGNVILNIDDCEVDHVIPFSYGGATDIENAQLLHKHCNRVKGNKITPTVFSDFEDDSDETEEENI